MILRTNNTGPHICITATWRKIPFLFTLPINLADLNDAFEFKNLGLGHCGYIILALKVPN